jgi:hypothetical protein
MASEWSLNNEGLYGFNVNRPDLAAPSDGMQSAPAVADNSGENFGIVYVTEGAGGPHIRFQAFDHALAPLDEILPGPVNFDDPLTGGSIITPGSGAPYAMGPAIAGWGDGFVGVWQEQMDDGSIVLRARATGPVGLVGGEFSIAEPLSPGAIQHGVSMAPYEKILGEDADGRDIIVNGFNIIWTETAPDGARMHWESRRPSLLPAWTGRQQRVPTMMSCP